jgi:hypothetical protein
MKRKLWESVSRKGPELWPDKWIVRHGSSLAHCVLRVGKVLGKKSITKWATNLLRLIRDIAVFSFCLN